MRAMAAPQKYSEELRDRATRMVMDAWKDPSTSKGAIRRIADQAERVNDGRKLDHFRRLKTGPPLFSSLR